MFETFADLGEHIKSAVYGEYVSVPLGYRQALEIELSDDGTFYTFSFVEWDHTNGVKDDVILATVAINFPHAVRPLVAELSKYYEVKE